ncbi:hypothetical protein ABFX02_14G043900 [Erythranthe guttata]|uniref:F-box/kelch-repeat protein At3g23880-like n=1 Tax=Erythranthe guttata TaxID=4155 RepID=UPI00064DC9D0|nr:PREDICTED: F-box/kelch-repeat protein At3g23880-like [Erythranthe guttata]|eukprot:XP_012843156.1 PREDICTED: F-box/kelch-repeat protein At3g23880-like [Erythranthe guttata]
MGKEINTLEIPEEIIEEILLNLPVKTLLKFKCVSKRWRSLISGNYFAKRHFKKSSSTTDKDLTDSTYQNRLTFFKRYQTNFFTVRSYSLRGEPVIDLSTGLDNLYPVRSSAEWGCVVGHFNGVVLITVSVRDVLLSWNPSTRRIKKIPLPSFSWGLLRDFSFGFGYHESTDEYTVVCVDISAYPEPCPAHVYSSKTNSWKKIRDFELGCPGRFSAKFVNGRFHWLLPLKVNGRGYDIVSLDSFEEKYEVVARPRCLDIGRIIVGGILDRYDHRLKLEELGGYLSLVVINVDSLWEVNIWAMMEYGAGESWTKVWTLSDFFDVGRRLICVMPLCLKNNGDIAVAVDSNVVVVCNGKNELCRSRINIVDQVKPVFYDESLVSPFGSDER